MYSIVTPNQQKTQQQTTVVNVAKTVFNNGQQRVHTLATLPTNARVIPGTNAANPPKVQILSNVVVSKQNIVINKSSLQVNTTIVYKKICDVIILPTLYIICCMIECCISQEIQRNYVGVKILGYTPAIFV